MNNSRVEIKVGLFVFIGAALIALLILNFSKGVTFGKSTYTLRLVLPNAAGLKPTADVMMSGVAIGKVTTEDLADDGRTVDIKMTIISRYKIRKGSKFHIDSLGFLGDQYIEVTPPLDQSTGDAVLLADGETVIGEPSFNVLEAVQSVSGVIDVAKKTIKDLDQAITNVNASALSTNTLSHFVYAVSNLQVVSERAVSAAGRAERLLSTNEDAFHGAVLNFQNLSARLTNTAAQLDGIVETNRDDIRKVVTNLSVASENFRNITTDVQAGKGPVGALLKDEEIRAQLNSIVSNADTIATELSLFSHNLNQRGVWAMLWKPKRGETNKAPAHAGENQVNR